MNPSSLTLERLEFSKIHVETNFDFQPSEDGVGPQLSFDFNGVNFRRKAVLRYPIEEAADPKHFYCMLGFKVAKEDQKDTVVPYELDLEVGAFFTYEDDAFKGADRFRAVRLSAYQMLYGAIREMVSNTTARLTYGMMQLPSADFRHASKVDSETDEKRRKERLTKIERAKTRNLAEDAEVKLPAKKRVRKSNPKKISSPE
ncbi:hypothetical protein [Burkholderia cepacia]|uniref:hypothetical protein n=1 Tax=Burkholderia cepacia TaxID=292 RepID=UPI0012D8B168|nr:hypothetical protein [Burkholderia cepacia]